MAERGNKRARTDAGTSSTSNSAGGNPSTSSSSSNALVAVESEGSSRVQQYNPDGSHVVAEPELSKSTWLRVLAAHDFVAAQVQGEGDNKTKKKTNKEDGEDEDGENEENEENEDDEDEYLGDIPKSARDALKIAQGHMMEARQRAEMLAVLTDALIADAPVLSLSHVQRPRLAEAEAAKDLASRVGAKRIALASSANLLRSTRDRLKAACEREARFVKGVQELGVNWLLRPPTIGDTGRASGKEGISIIADYGIVPGVSETSVRLSAAGVEDEENGKEEKDEDAMDVDQAETPVTRQQQQAAIVAEGLDDEKVRSQVVMALTVNGTASGSLMSPGSIGSSLVWEGDEDGLMSRLAGAQHASLWRQAFRWMVGEAVRSQDPHVSAVREHAIALTLPGQTEVLIQTVTAAPGQHLQESPGVRLEDGLEFCLLAGVVGHHRRAKTIGGARAAVQAVRPTLSWPSSLVDIVFQRQAGGGPPGLLEWTRKTAEHLSMRARIGAELENFVGQFRGVTLATLPRGGREFQWHVVWSPVRMLAVTLGDTELSVSARPGEVIAEPDLRYVLLHELSGFLLQELAAEARALQLGVNVSADGGELWFGANSDPLRLVSFKLGRSLAWAPRRAGAAGADGATSNGPSTHLSALTTMLVERGLLQ